MNRLFQRLRRIREDRNLPEEARRHIQERIDDLVENGMEPHDARHRANREFGNATAIRQEIHEAHRLFPLETLWQDLRLAARNLSRRPGFSAGVALTLALGIGATTTAFTAVDGVVLRRLPYKDPSTLAAVGWLDRSAEWVEGAANLQNLTPIWDPAFVKLRERARSFSELAALSLDEFTLAEPGNGLPPERVRAARVTPGLLEMLDARPSFGRTFLPEEYEMTSRVAMISHGAWQRRFGAAPDTVGRTIQGSTGPLAIVGILPPDFRAPEAFVPLAEAPELWLPLDVERSDGRPRRVQELLVLGRLAPPASVDRARAEVARIAAALAVEYPSQNVQRGIARRIGVNDLHAQTVGTTGKLLNLFLWAASLLLILAAINAATLLLARSLDRAKEFGVRIALGAGRLRLMRLLAAETGILAIAGGVLGVLLAYAGVAMLVRFAPVPIPRLDLVTVDARVWIVAALISLGAGILAGMLPSLRMTAHSTWNRIHDSARGLAGGTSSRLRTFLVAAQIAAAVVLLSATGLLFRSFVRLQNADLGFEDRDVLAMGVEVKGSSAWNFQSHWSSWDALLADLRAVPGVASVALASNIPFQSPKWTPRVLTTDDSPDAVLPGVSGYAITPGYLSLMGTSIVAGRDFGPRDGPGAERVVLVNVAFARSVLGRDDVIGRTILWSPGTEWAEGDEWIPPAEWRAGRPTPLRIVGVVEDVVQLRLGEAARPAIYVPYTQSRPTSPTAVIRTSVPLQTIEAALRAAVARFNPRAAAPSDLAPMALRERTILRFQVLLIGSFAALSIFLAAAGLYGSMLQFVAIRRREFGLRMALGADRTGIFAFVLGKGGLVSLAGLACGITIVLFSANLLSGFLFGVPPHDLVTLTASGALLLLISAAACVIPAYHATAVDPAIVLKED